MPPKRRESFLKGLATLAIVADAPPAVKEARKKAAGDEKPEKKKKKVKKVKDVGA